MSTPSDELLVRFRAVSLDRIGRVEVAWNHLVIDGHRSVDAMLAEVRTVKGDAAIVGEASVFHLCQKLDDLLRLAAQREFAISDDFERVVTMAIQFVCTVLRGKRRAMAGLDLFGFIRHVDEVLAESRDAAPASADAAAAEDDSPTGRRAGR